MKEYVKEVNQVGAVLVAKLFSEEVKTIIQPELPEDLFDREHRHRRGGLRHPQKQFRCLNAVLNSNKIPTLLGEGYRLVRSLLFDKTADANWAVPWHQDLTIAVKEKRDVNGYGPWSVKEGMPHVRPPVSLLGDMITLRVHLDDTFAGNGPLKIIPESHLDGILDPGTIQNMDKDGLEKVFEAAAGDVLLMKPLVLHASKRCENPKHRRILHLEYSNQELPGGLAWDQNVDNGNSD